MISKLIILSKLSKLVAQSLEPLVSEIQWPNYQILETKMVALVTAKKKKKKSVFRDWTANTGGQNSVFHHRIANIGG